MNGIQKRIFKISKKHGISFEEAKNIFSNDYLTRTDDRFDYGEIREISMGKIKEAIILVVVHTDRKEKVRVISARRANERERKIYWRKIEN